MHSYTSFISRRKSPRTPYVISFDKCDGTNENQDAWIVFCSLLTFPIVYSYGNLTAVDAFFFGCSSSTESGLNT